MGQFNIKVRVLITGTQAGKMKSIAHHDPSLQIVLDGKIFEDQPLGGISRIYHEILPRTCDIDHRILFFILTAGRLRQGVPAHPQITHYHSEIAVDCFLRPQSVFWKLQDYLRVRLQIAFIQPAKNMIWHASYFQLPAWWEGPKVVSVYDLIYEKFPQFFNKNYDKILRERKKHSVLAADRVICISETVRAEVIEMYNLPRERVVVVPLAPGDIFRRMKHDEIQSMFQVEQPFILYVGARNHYKNFKALLNAYAVWPRRNEVSLLVVGQSWSEEEQKEIRAAGLESRVICRSNVTDDELCALYNQALVFVYPSLAEGFGIPLLEAIACGCPIVASRIPIFIEIAKDVPYYFDPLNRDELIAALEAACFSGSKKKGGEDLLRKYSWDRNAQATLEIYKELTAGTYL